MPLPAKSAVKSRLCQPRSQLGGPDLAELLFMGSYPGKPGPQMGPKGKTMIIEQS